MEFKNLKSLGVLSNKQLKFLNDMQFAEENIELDGIVEKETSPAVREKIFVIANNLDIMIHHLKNSKTDRLEFMQKYPAWSKKREESIGKLREIVEDLNSDRFNCNVSRLSAYGTALVGGGLVLASAILIPFTGGLSVPLGIAGGALTAAGSATAFGTAITEIYRVKSKVSKAQVIVKEDKEFFEILSRWMKHKEALNEAQDNILEIDIVKDIYSDVKKLVNGGLKIENTNERLDYLKREIKKIITCSSKSIEIPVIGIKTLISLLTIMHMIISSSECRLLFDCASLALKLTSGAFVLTDQITNVSSLITAHAFSKGVAKAAARGTFAAIGMTLDVAGIILTSIDIHKGSCSSQAKEIVKVANEMEKEAEVLQEIYKNLVEKSSSAKHIILSFLLDKDRVFSPNVIIACFLILLFAILWYG